MIKEALVNSSIMFKPKQLAHYGIVVPKEPPSADMIADPRYEAHVAAMYYKGAYGNPDKIPQTRAEDVRTKLHDFLLTFSLLWWFLEFFPILERKQAGDGEWIWRPQWVCPLLRPINYLDRCSHFLDLFSRSLFT